MSTFNTINAKSYIQLNDVSVPSNPSAGQGRIYKKMGNADIFWKPDAAGSEVNLVNLFDQTLNTTDDVIFNKINTQSSLNFVNTGGAVLWNNSSNQYLAEVSDGNLVLRAENSLLLNGNGNTKISDALTMGSGATDYTLLNTRGTANQLLQINGSGATTWTSNLNLNSIVSNSVQTNSVQTSSVQTSTVSATSINTSSVECLGLGIGEFPTANISIKTPIGQDAVIKLDTTDTQNSAIQLNNVGVKQWIVENLSNNNFSITKANSEEVLGINQTSGAITINPSTNSTTLPTTRGTANQVLTTDGAGTATWVNTSNDNPFDQDLNTTDAPDFTGLTVGNNASTSSVLNMDSANGGIMDINFSQGAGLPILEYQLRYNGTYLSLANVSGAQPIFDTENSKMNIKTNLVIANGKNIQLGTDSNVANSNCVIMKFQTFTAMEKGRVVTIVNDNGVGKIRKIEGGDLDSEAVIGITSEAGVINSDVGVCIGGVFEGCVQNGETIEIGQFLEKSGSGSNTNDGRITGNNTPSIGTFGVSITSATGNSAGTIFIKGIYRKNESY
jgi:hypothetical protein